MLIHLLSGTDTFPGRALKDMASALENVYWEFSRISQHHITINVTSGAQSKDAQTVRCLVLIIRTVLILRFRVDLSSTAFHLS